MTQYDFEKKQWKTEPLPKEIGKAIDGSLMALDRVGEDEVLPFLGREQRDSTGTQSRRSMETMWIYNIQNSTWHKQITTGEIPVRRRQSYFFIVPAPDLSNYRIYIFSGTVEQEPATLLDLYVLTVAGFIWKEISLTDAGYPDTYPINTHQCSPHKDGRQTFTVPERVGIPHFTPSSATTASGSKFDWNGNSNPILTWLSLPQVSPNQSWFTTSGAEPVSGGWQDSALNAIFEKRNAPVDISSSSSSLGGISKVPGLE
ncbi:hypothetical protein BGX38DRAFT_1333727 [Terfezia claveryi]|nr:hypothetical protein BGX38DRAFT_1333727 [Terfezia claveryi]